MSKPKPRLQKRKSRRKLGSRPYKNYTPQMLELAIESVAKNTITSREAEKQFGIPRRTILNKLKDRHLKPVGKPTRLSEEEENKLVNVIIASADYGSPLTKLDLRILVQNYLKKNGKDYLFNNKMPGEKWVNNLLTRHREKLTVRSTQNITTSRAQKGEDEILNYFNNLRDTLKGVPPANILNYDETNCSDDPGTLKAIFRRGVKYPERIVNSTKGCVSLMFSGTADGQCLPPYVVYKSENLYNEWILNGPTDARYNCTRSGWFDAAMFEDYFPTIVLDWVKTITGPKVVIGDNLSSHLSPEIVQLCEEHEIKFVFLPPNSTHLTQPLDVAFFGPLKKEWRKILLKYKAENPSQKTMNKKHFPVLLKTLIENIEMRQSKNLQSGFKATGIYPLNPREVLKRIPEFQFPDSTAYQIDESLLDYLKQSRAPNPIKTVRNKKIYVEPGKSVSVTDFKNEDLLQKPKKNKTKKKEAKPKLKKVKTDKIIHKTEESNAEISDENTFNEKNIDNITYYSEGITTDIDKLPNIEEQQEQIIETNILNEKTGIFQTFLITNAIIEKPPNHLENDRIQIHYEFIDPDSKENIENSSDTETIGTNKAPNLNRKHIIIKTKNKPKKRSNILLEDNVNICDVDDDEDEVVKEKTHKMEAEIFNEIMRIDLQNDIVEDTKTDSRVAAETEINFKDYVHTEITKTIDVRGESINNKEQLQIEEENKPNFLNNNIEITELNIGANVLVRYYQKKKWTYYIGMIIEINNQVEKKYKISYYKTISKKGDIKFKKPKRPDIDDISNDLLVKQVELLQINENNEFVLFNDEDASLYF